jgi:ubiquitin carboxyl-terminal hydrolase 8
MFTSAGGPGSPTRASSYKHVHDAVAVNFHHVLLRRQQQQQHDPKNHAGPASSTDQNRTSRRNGSNAAAPLPTPLGVVGICNLGNTCFLNSSLQCLSATIPLTDYFLGYDYRSEINRTNVLGTGGRLATEYAELMKAMWLNNDSAQGVDQCDDDEEYDEHLSHTSKQQKRARQRKSKKKKTRKNGGAPPIGGAPIRPIRFKRQLETFAPQFRGCHQHDSQELLAYLLDGIHEDLNRIEHRPIVQDRDCDGTNDERDAIAAWKNYLLRNKSLVVDIFQGQLKSTLRCTGCGHASIRFEPFMYLSLPITPSCRSVQDCLEVYLEEEAMTGPNQWYCSRCRGHRDATRKTDIWVLPPILMVHLKRFNFDDCGRIGAKNTAEIRYPVHQWDLTGCVRSRGSESPVYDLYAVSNHVGSLAGGGHYTAYAQNRFNDQWYEFNDSAHRPIGLHDLERNCRSAYVLFYNRATMATPPQPHPRDPESPMSSAAAPAGSPTGTSSSSSFGRKPVPLIRRQSVNRPDLWPHTQVLNSQFRGFSRQSLRSLLLPNAPFLGASSSTSTLGVPETNSTNDAVEVKVKDGEV